MPTRIVYCADGTWNNSKDETNVHRFFDALQDTGTQLRIYSKGVGNDGSRWRKLWGAATGEGLLDNVKDGYFEIATRFGPGDRIYLFGFSRGAYTARSLAGMIAYCGLPTDKPERYVEAAFAAYRSRPRTGSTWGERPAAFDDATIVMVGVWDTVGQLGIPGRLFARRNALKYGFLDTTLSPTVAMGYQALSLDEKRRQFVPTLWSESPSDAQKLEQVWFTGSHSDVGGGGTRNGLADITLAWMLHNADSARLELTDDAREWCRAQRRNQDAALAPVGRSWDPRWGGAQRRSVRATASVADTVQSRVARRRRYWPPLIIEGLIRRRLASSYHIERVTDS